MRLTATDNPAAWCLSVTRLCYAKTADRIEVLLEVENFGNPNHIAVVPVRLRRGGDELGKILLILRIQESREREVSSAVGKLL